MLLNYDTSELWEFLFGVGKHVLSRTCESLGFLLDDALPISGSFLPSVVLISTQLNTLGRYIRRTESSLSTLASPLGTWDSQLQLLKSGKLLESAWVPPPCSIHSSGTFPRQNHSITGLTSFVSHLLKIIFLP